MFWIQNVRENDKVRAPHARPATCLGRPRRLPAPPDGSEPERPAGAAVPENTATGALSLRLTTIDDVGAALVLAPHRQTAVQ